MHIPDGFLSNRMALGLDAVSGLGILYAAGRLKLALFARAVPIMGVLSAFVFGAQMINFPVLGGTSGHLVGGALLGILLGPVAGFLSMATVIIAQALFLQDGGLLALGANLFNIGAITVCSGYGVHRLFGSPQARGRRLAVTGFLAGWISVVVSAVACALELGLSGAIPLRIGLPAMGGYHAVIGLVEGGLTLGVLSFLARVRPDLLRSEHMPGLSIWDWVGGTVLVAVPFGILVLAGSSSLPDPLQSLLSEAPVLAGQGEGLLSLDRVAGAYWIGFPFLMVALAFLIRRMVRMHRGPS